MLDPILQQALADVDVEDEMDYTAVREGHRRYGRNRGKKDLPQPATGG